MSEENTDHHYNFVFKAIDISSKGHMKAFFEPPDHAGLTLALTEAGLVDHITGNGDGMQGVWSQINLKEHWPGMPFEQRYDEEPAAMAQSRSGFKLRESELLKALKEMRLTRKKSITTSYRPF